MLIKVRVVADLCPVLGLVPEAPGKGDVAGVADGDNGRRSSVERRLGQQIAAGLCPSAGQQLGDARLPRVLAVLRQRQGSAGDEQARGCGLEGRVGDSRCHHGTTPPALLLCSVPWFASRGANSPSLSSTYPGHVRIARGALRNKFAVSRGVDFVGPTGRARHEGGQIMLVVLKVRHHDGTVQGPITEKNWASVACKRGVCHHPRDRYRIWSIAFGWQAGGRSNGEGVSESPLASRARPTGQSHCWRTHPSAFNACACRSWHRRAA